MTIQILILGGIFGALLRFAQLNRYNTISGMAMLTDFTVAKAIAVAIGIGALIINTEIALGFASYHVKPFLLMGVALGGLLFGVGMAILGYCPGTLAVSLGEGSLDALFGIIGGLISGLLYTLWVPNLSIWTGPDLGVLSLNSLVGGNNLIFFVLLILISAIFIYAAFWMHRKEKGKDYKWLISGAGLAILNSYIFLSATTNRVIGASTTYPYLADLLSNTRDNAYFTKIEKSGNWELLFLAGAFLAALIIALVRKEFKLVLLHTNWKKHKNDNAVSRIIWAFVGGFILIFGARFAGGCTSGHVLSGGMQLAISSLVFAVFVFAGLLITGRLFYSNSAK